MKFTKIALGLLCTTVLFCGCAKNNEVVMKINDEEITRSQFYDDFNKIKDIQLKDAPKAAKKDDSFPVLSIKERYINDFIARKLLEAEYEKRKIEVSEDELNKKREQIVKQIGGEEKFNLLLKENNVTQEKAMQDFSNEVKIEKLVKELVPTDVNEAEAKKYYDKNISQFTSPARVSVSHILFGTNPEIMKRKIADDDKDGKLSAADIDKKVKEEIAKKDALAKEVLQKAQKNPKDFAKLAEQYSDDEGSAKKGGDLGYIVKEQVVPEFAQAAFTQKVGKVGPLVKSDFGMHIILVKDKTAEGTQSFASVKNELMRYLTEKKRIETLQTYIENLKKSTKIEYIDESLNPDNIKKQIEEAIQKQIDEQKKEDTQKTKLEPAKEESTK